MLSITGWTFALWGRPPPAPLLPGTALLDVCRSPTVTVLRLETHSARPSADLSSLLRPLPPLPKKDSPRQWMFSSVKLFHEPSPGEHLLTETPPPPLPPRPACPPHSRSLLRLHLNFVVLLLPIVLRILLLLVFLVFVFLPPVLALHVLLLLVLYMFNILEKNGYNLGGKTLRPFESPSHFQRKFLAFSR